MTHRLLILPCAALLAAGAHAGSFYAIGPDPGSFVPDQFDSVTTSAQAVSTIAAYAENSQTNFAESSNQRGAVTSGTRLLRRH